MMGATCPDRARLSVLYVDGRSGQVQQVNLWIEQGMLQLAGPGLFRQIPLCQIRWSDLNSHGRLIAQLPKGAALHANDKLAWLQWRGRENIADSSLQRRANGWHWRLFAGLLLLAICATSYIFALPHQQI